MPETLFDPRTLRAVLFDLDGTLYRQDAVRQAMLVRLIRAHLLHPMRGMQTIRVLSAYRKAQEQMRESLSLEAPSANLAEAQIRLAADCTGLAPDVVAECVAHWMERVPLDLVGRAIQPDLEAFLSACKASGLRLGVLSDYPAAAKLTALGLDGIFDVVLAAQSAEVGVFKPNPRGLLVAAERLKATPAECVYIGDRAAVDGPAAVAAGMACFIVSHRSNANTHEPWTHVAGFARLQALFSPLGGIETPVAVPQPRLNVG